MYDDVYTKETQFCTISGQYDVVKGRHDGVTDLPCQTAGLGPHGANSCVRSLNIDISKRGSKLYIMGSKN